MKFLQLISLMICAGFFLMVFSNTYNQDANANDNKEYKFLTEDFQSAFEKLNADAFYKTKVEYPETMKNFFQSPQNENQKKRVSFGKAVHYEKVANKICADISDAYLEILDTKIEGRHIFDFTDELNMFLETQEAYVLPLHSTHGYLNATYYNQDWDKNSTDIGGNRKFADFYNQDFNEKERNRTSVSFKEGGLIEVDTVPTMIEWYRRYQTFKEYALEVRKVELKKEIFVLDMVQPYLLIYPQNAADITQDIVYLYMEFPYRITGSDLTSPTKIVLRDRKTDSVCRIKSGKDCIEEVRYKPEVKCHARSTNLMKVQASDQNRYKENKAVAMVLGGSPLGYPIPKKFISDDAYELEKGEFADPSLKCWLKIMSDDKSDIESCISSAYADKFLSMVNRDVCLRNNGITPIADQKFPISLPYGDPSYLITQFNPRCGP